MADVVEAIASYRTYRPSLGIDIALEEISNDPDVTEVRFKLFSEKGFHF